MEKTMSNIHEQRILVLDYGSPYTQLIARRVREIGVYCEVRVYDITAEEFAAFAPQGVIISDGPESPLSVTAPSLPEFLLTSGVPVLGIGYGMRLIAHALGGVVFDGEEEEVLVAAQVEHAGDLLLHELSDAAEGDAPSLEVWLNQLGKVSQVPEGFLISGSAAGSPVRATTNEEPGWRGRQSHPALNTTGQGTRNL